MAESPSQPGAYSTYEPVFDALNFDGEHLEEAREESNAAQLTTRKSTLLFRLATVSLFAVIALLIATFFIQGLGSNASALRVLLLFGLGWAARYFLARRYQFQEAVRKESTAGQALSRVELQIAKAKSLHSAIRHVLLDVWDPIGIKDEPNAQDEYDRYIPRIYELLVSAAPDSELADYLYWMAHDRMGFDNAQIADMKETVQALRVIPLRRAE